METTLKVLERVRAEFVEMPGMRLTAQQVERLCGIEPTLCATVLAALVAAKFLSITPDGKYARSREVDATRSRPRSCRRKTTDPFTQAPHEECAHPPIHPRGDVFDHLRAFQLLIRQS